MGEAQTYSNAYTKSVVVGQVMTHNDPNFNVFWARGSTQTRAPEPNALFVGKHVGEDAPTDRAQETIGYIVVEAGTGTVDRNDAPQPMASVVGLTLSNATQTLELPQFVVGDITRTVDPILTADTVQTQAILAGVTAPRATVVDLHVSQATPITFLELTQILLDALPTADTNADGSLSTTEADTVVPGLSTSAFNTLDTDLNGTLSVVELGGSVKAEQAEQGALTTQRILRPPSQTSYF